MLELKRGDRPRVRTDALEFIALLFPFSSELTDGPTDYPWVSEDDTYQAQGHRKIYRV